MAVASVLMSVGTVAIDTHLAGSQFIATAGWLWSGGAEGARSLLSTVASSMITVAGTVFSITIAALTLASSQFGPRLLRNFTRDTGNQVVLGTFIATFLYCLLVLRTIRDQNEGGFVPNLSVSCGVLLAVASLGVLIYFIHHVAGSIQAESLIASVGSELNGDIVRLHPPGPSSGAKGSTQPDDDELVVLPSLDDERVSATVSGYVQAIDQDALLEIAETCDLVIALTVRAGDFASVGAPLLRARTPADGLSDDQTEQLRDAFSLGARRTPTQDIRYGIRQLTEIGARALSPGINDPFTANGCADWLADALAELARRTPQVRILRGEGGQPRLIVSPVGFAELVHLSFDPLRFYGASSPIVTGHLLQVLARLVNQIERPDDREAVMHMAELTVATARNASTDATDLQALDEGLLQVRLAASRRPPARPKPPDASSSQD